MSVEAAAFTAKILNLLLGALGAGPRGLVCRPGEPTGRPRARLACPGPRRGQRAVDAGARRPERAVRRAAVWRVARRRGDPRAGLLRRAGPQRLRPRSLDWRRRSRSSHAPWGWPQPPASPCISSWCDGPRGLTSWRRWPARWWRPLAGERGWRGIRAVDPALAMNYGSYFETVQQAGLGVFRASARDLPRPLADLVFGGLPAPLYYLLGAVALAIGLYGLTRIVRRSPIGFTLICYFAILAIWPFPPDRFLWAVLPWLVLVWAAGALALFERPAFRLPVVVMVTTMIAGYGWDEARGFAGRWWGLTASQIIRQFSELLPWSRALPPGSVLAIDDEALVWLYTRQPAVPFYLYGYRGSTETHPTPAEHRAYLERQGVTHVLLAGYGGGSAKELNTLLGAYPGWLTIIHRWPGGRPYSP